MPEWFADKGDITYCINFKSRLNANFDREDAIRVIGEIVRELNPQAKVEYKTPKLTIIVEVMKSYCCLSVLENYFEWKKFNLIEIAKTDEEKLIEKRKKDNNDSQIEDDKVKVIEEEKVNTNQEDKVNIKHENEVNIKEKDDKVEESVADTQ